MYKRILFLLLLASSFTASTNGAFAQAKKPGAKQKLPNIVWITCEDMGPHLGCYGDKYAVSPNIDGLAKKSLRYLYCWSNAPVCAPARTTIIMGMYATSTGAQHMRSQSRVPEELKMYPMLLRMLGYYCTNRVKEDYNLVKNGKVWDDSSRKAHWRNRRPGQPFFAVFNLTISHESQIRNKIAKLTHDPKKVKLPAYHPDVFEVRRDWAQYYDRITQMDQQVGKLLRELEEAGLMENTIIFFYADHGSGMPRSKRFAGNSGFHVPLIVYVPQRYRDLAPEDYRPGGTTDRLVSFVDLAPTLLSIAGQRPPAYEQGHAFMGKYAAPPQPYIYGFRGRMDERCDMSRSLRDKRYVYIRNYWPHRPHGQYLAYQMKTPTTRVWKKLYDMGKLNKVQSLFWQKRSPEELYDLKNDPDEIHNLAGMPKYEDILKRFREAHKEHVFKIRDVGFLPENEIHTRAKGSTPYEMGHDPKKYPLRRIFPMAQLASSLKPDVTPQLLQGLKDSDSAVRYWAAMGFLMRGKDTVRRNLQPLRKALDDRAPSVQIAAAEALGTYGDPKDVQSALKALVRLGDPRKNDVHQVVMALNVLDALGDKVTPVLPQIRSWPNKMRKSSDPRSNYGVPRLIASITARGKSSNQRKKSPNK